MTPTERVAKAISDAGFAWKAANGGDSASWTDIPDEVFAVVAFRESRDICIRMLQDSYPDHAWLNAVCAAIRSLECES